MSAVDFRTDTDTIAAIATAPGAGGVGIIRISGPKAHDILLSMFRPSSPAGSTNASHTGVCTEKVNFRVLEKIWPPAASNRPVSGSMSSSGTTCSALSAAR